jgi:hypothetical protein
LLFEILTGVPAEFESVNNTIPDVGKHQKAPQLLPGKGRLIKTHERYRKEYQRAIYLVRDVRDVVISEYFYQRLTGVYSNAFDNFLELFMKGKVNAYGFWANHVDSWLDISSKKTADFLFIKFEDMRQETEQVIGKILEFLGTSVNTIIIQHALHNNTIKRMQKKEDRARQTIFKKHQKDFRFVRKGSTGGWHQTLTDAQVQFIEHHAGKTLAQLGYQLKSLRGNEKP